MNIQENEYMANFNTDVLNNVCEEVKNSIIPFCEKLKRGDYEPNTKNI